MSANKRNNSSIVLKPNTNIGSVSAEEDQYFLSKCFIETPGYEAVCDLDSSGCILLGRTGAGKSAIIQKLLADKDNAREVDPQSLSLNFIANSKLLNLMNDLGVDLDVFYQLIWRHVLAVELIQCKQNFENEAKAQNFFTNLRSKFSNSQRKQTALKQLEKYCDSYFANTSDRVENIIKNIEADLGAKIDFEKLGIPLTISGSISLKKEVKEEIVHNAQEVINNIDIRGLTEIISIIADDVFDDPMQEFYIVIDELDEKWVDTKLKYHLIRALIESIKKFRRVRRAKIVISLREDLLEKVLKETRFAGGQEEKYEDLYLRIQWKPKDLRELVERRVSWLFKDKYTRKEICFADVFSNKVQDEPPFEYMLDRTLMRPRDIIQFINYCLEAAEGHTKATAKVIRESEARYSKKRYAALLQEWEIVNPLTDVYCSLLEDKKAKFSISDFSKDDTDNFAIRMLEQEGTVKHDPVALAAERYSEGNMSRRNFLRNCVQELYKIGVLGLKNVGSAPSWSYLHEPVVSPNEIKDATVLFIHPMLWRHLSIFQKNISALNIRAL